MNMKAYGAMVGAMVLWAGSFVAMKDALAVMDPWLVVLGRMLLAAAAFSLLWRRTPPAGDIRRHLPKLLVMALSEPCLYFVFEAKALTLTTASQAGMITSLLPVMVACAAGLFLGERPGARAYAGLGLGFLGAGLLSALSPSDQYSPNPILGNLLELAAMGFATVYTLMVKRLVRHFSPIFLTAFQVVAGSFFFLPVLALVPLPGTIELRPLAAIVYLGLGVSVGAYACYNYSLSRLPASTVAGAVNLIPAFTLALSWALLGETIAGWQWLGILMILAGARLAGHSS